MKPFELLADGKVLRLTYTEGIEMLRAAGEPIDDFADMKYFTYFVSHLTTSTTQEKLLGRLIKEKYHTDFCISLQIPSSSVNSLFRCPRQIPS